MKVTIYKELKQILKKFAEGHFRLLIIVGPPGTAKTTAVRELLGEIARWVNASLSAFQFYVELWRYKDVPFVIDDVDNLCRDPAMVRLLKALCDSQETRRVCWLTASSLLSNGEDDDKPPREFETRSRLIIIANDWKTLNKHIAALNDRGHIIHFEPYPEAVHAEVARWFRDGEIYGFIGRHLRLVGRHHSMRWYVQAADWKRADLDWSEMLLRSWDLDPEDALVIRLLEDSTLSTAERVKRFSAQAQKGKSRRTYFYRCSKVGGAQGGNPLHSCTDLPVTSAEVQPNPVTLPMTEAVKEPVVETAEADGDNRNDQVAPRNNIPATAVIEARGADTEVHK